MQYIGVATGHTTSYGDTLDTSTTLDILAGDVVVAYVSGFFAAGNDVATIAEDDASNGLTVLSASNDGWKVQGGYSISASVSTGATFRAVLDRAHGNEWELVVLQFRPGAGETVSFGSGPASANSGWGSNPTSANLSTTSDDSLFVGAASNDRANLTSHQIAGASTDGVIQSANFAFDIARTVFSSSQTSINYSTSSSLGIWAAQLICLDITVTGGGTSPISCAGSFGISGSATLKATGALSASEIVAFSASANLGSIGMLSASETITLSNSATLKGKGELNSTGQLNLSANASLVATGTLQASESIQFTDTASIQGTGSLSVAEAITLSSAANLTDGASTSMTANGSISLSGSGALTGIGDLIATGNITLSPTAALTAIGNLAASSAIDITGTATLDGLTGNNLSSVGLISMTGSANINAYGELVCNGQILFDGVASIRNAAIPDIVQIISSDGTIIRTLVSIQTIDRVLTQPGKLS